MKIFTKQWTFAGFAALALSLLLPTVAQAQDDAASEQPAADEAATMWGPYEVNAGGYADTGEFLGLLWVGDSPWVYAYAFEAWFYIDPATIGTQGTGAWGYRAD
ncbi:MAG: hypothetical protein E1N59_673 [Puniceicoccaceae bacterium 5H]|nr:MAG: hypothetical protein E1N59_673 [Puniceicoccaceae bacterium 5H]